MTILPGRNLRCLFVGGGGGGQGGLSTLLDEVVPDVVRINEQFQHTI